MIPYSLFSAVFITLIVLVSLSASMGIVFERPVEHVTKADRHVTREVRLAGYPDEPVRVEWTNGFWQIDTDGSSVTFEPSIRPASPRVDQYELDADVDLEELYNVRAKSLNWTVGIEDGRVTVKEP